MTPDRIDTHMSEGPSPSHPPRGRLTNVVGHDGSTNGRNVVEGAARRLAPGDRLIIVHALDPQARDADLSTDREEIHRRVSNDLDQSRLAGIDYELRVVEGPAAEVLITIALEARAAGIVIGTRRGPTRLGQRTIRSELEAGPVPVVALYRTAERESHPHGEPIDLIHRHGHDSFPASDPPASWSGPASNGRPHPIRPRRARV